MTENNIANLTDRLKQYGLKESTINTLYEYSNDMSEKIIAVKHIGDSEYGEIAHIMGRYHKLFFISIEKGLKKFVEKNIEFSDYDIIKMGEILKDQTMVYIDKLAAEGSL